MHRGLGSRSTGRMPLAATYEYANCRLEDRAAIVAELDRVREICCRDLRDRWARMHGSCANIDGASMRR